MEYESGAARQYQTQGINLDLPCSPAVWCVIRLTQEEIDRTQDILPV